MSPRPFPPAGPALPAPAHLGTRLREWLFRRWPGRFLLGALAVLALQAAGLPLPDLLTVPATLVAALFAVWAAYALARWTLRRLLWRIRTKLILSYLFIAVVPVVLLGLFFLLAGALFSGLVASSLVTAELDRRSEELGRAADQALADLGRSSSAATVEARLAGVRARHPQLAYALVHDGEAVAAWGPALPTTLPGWWKGSGFSGLVKHGERGALRAVSARGNSFLVLEVPVSQGLFTELERKGGVRLLASGGKVEASGSSVHIEFPPGDTERDGGRPGSSGVTGLVFLATPDQTVWETGAREPLPLAFQYQPWLLVSRLTPGVINTADVLVKLLAALGGVFLVVYALALLAGLLLARSITRSVHALSRGTERLRRGVFDQPIPVHSRDQLGELAESFNLMAAGIEDLLRESAEKERLEEELRIARSIQMSLLPRNGAAVPGLRTAACCIPAAEVGGDYYDLLPLGGERLAVLVADVSGKGTSAALYMAELKGLMLSLSRAHDSPARLLAEANRILAADMDPRSFITMSYAVVDASARRMRWARAGHSPLIQRDAGGGGTRLLTPAGLGLGLDGGPRFDELLEEQEVALRPGDLFLFFTDGLSEAMSPGGELFGEERLRQILARDGGLGSEGVKESILREVRGFVGGSPPHDDMTMVVLEVA